MLAAERDETAAVSRRQSLDHRGMLVARERQMLGAGGGDRAGAMDLLGEPLDQLDQMGVAAGAEQGLVEADIGPEGASRIARRHRLGMELLQGAQRAQDVRCNGQPNLLGGERLQHLADGIDLTDLGGVEQPDHGAAVGDALDQPAPLELGQRLAQPDQRGSGAVSSRRIRPISRS